MRQAEHPSGVARVRPLPTPDSVPVFGMSVSGRLTGPVAEVWEALNVREPGNRPARRAEAELLLTMRLMHEEDLDQETANQRARAFLEAQTAEWHKRLATQMARIARTSLTVPRRTLCPEVEIHAVLQLPEVRWLRDWLAVAPDGRPAARDRLLYVLFMMAWSASPPTIRDTFQRLEGNAKVGWAFDYRTEGPGLATIYRTMRTLGNRRDPRAVLHVNVSLLRRFARLRTAAGDLAHPDLGKYLAVDGTDIEADIRQVGPRDREHRDMMRGWRELAEFRVYERDDRITASVFGYKLVVISCITTGLPLIWGVYGSSVSEQRAALDLLGQLRALWPDIPAKYLVADAGFDSNVFPQALWWNHSVHGVIAASRKERYDAKQPWWKESKIAVGERGVPVCAHGLMLLHKPEGFAGADARRALGIAFGAPMPRTGPRLRWRCRERECKTVETKPWDYPRLYTFLPRAGDHRRAVKRQALMLRRLDIESLFALTKYFGIDGAAPMRARWADDAGMCWLISLHLLYITGRRIAHETGEYAASDVEATMLGVREIATLDNPSPGPTPEEAAAALQRRRSRQRPAARPDTWPDDTRRHYSARSRGDAMRA